MALHKEELGTEFVGAYQEPWHPGVIIKRRLFAPLNITQKEFCETHNIKEAKFSKILSGALPITAETAFELSQAFQLSEMFFMNLQNRHDLEIARRRRED